MDFCGDTTESAVPAVVYLSDVRDESPRYERTADAPRWLHPELRATNGGGLTPRGFLLRGPRSPALLVFEPETTTDADGLRPAAIVCAGGGYAHMNPREGEPVARWLSGRLGLVSAVLRYRLDWPRARDDLHDAINWLASPEARTTYRIDASRLLLVGFSAGAHLAAHGGAMPGVRGLVLVYPAASDAGGVPTVEEHSVPPAVYLVGSTNDRLTPVVENADVVAVRLRELGSRVVYQRSKLGAHGFGLTPKWATPAGAWILSEI